MKTDNIENPIMQLQCSLPAHKCSLSITHNQHKDYYESLEAYLKDNDGCKGWQDERARLRAISTNEIWEMQWYPHTPIGSHKIYAPTLVELMQFADTLKTK